MEKNMSFSGSGKASLPNRRRKASFEKLIKYRKKSRVRKKRYVKIYGFNMSAENISSEKPCGNTREGRRKLASLWEQITVNCQRNNLYSRDEEEK